MLNTIGNIAFWWLFIGFYVFIVFVPQKRGVLFYSAAFFCGPFAWFLLLIWYQQGTRNENS